MRSLFLVLAAAMVCSVEAKTCKPAEAQSAEVSAAMLKSWQEIHAAFRRYAHCDDGSIAESFSDAVVHQLASNWAAIAQVQSIISKDSSFEAFVIRHVDASADAKELELVAQYSCARCPPEAKELCIKLHKASSGKRVP